MLIQGIITLLVIKVKEVLLIQLFASIKVLHP